jgi:prepilin-type N-terminal cleavage/methylation domain-containing protein
MKKIGVTLIELLIVMIIIAILSVVIFVSMTGSLEDAETTQRKEVIGNLPPGIQRSGQAFFEVRKNTNRREDIVSQQDEESEKPLEKGDESQATDSAYEDPIAMSDDLQEAISSRSEQFLEDERGREERERSTPEPDSGDKDPNPK